MGIRNALVFFVIVWNICLFEIRGQENTAIDIEYLYNDWAYSYNEFFEDIILLRRATDKEYLSLEERKDWYNFEDGNDSILHYEKINAGRRFYCVVGYTNNKEYTVNNKEEESRGLCDLWTYNPTSLTLTHTLVSDFGESRGTPIFTSIYKILEIEEDYIKLQLLKELFEGLE